MNFELHRKKLSEESDLRHLKYHQIYFFILLSKRSHYPNLNIIVIILSAVTVQCLNAKHQPGKSLG